MKGDFIFEHNQFHIAAATVRDCVCAQCWGILVQTNIAEHKTKVHCPKCGEDRGFVTREFAQRRIDESKGELIEAKLNLAAAMGMSDPKKTNDQLLKELGY